MGFISDTSQTKTSDFAILLVMASTIEGLPGIPDVSLSTTALKEKFSSFENVLTAFSSAASIKDLLSLFGKSDCQE